MRSLLLILIIILLASCSKEEKITEYSLHSDLEQISESGFVTTHPLISLRTSDLQTGQESFSGQYSIMTTKERQYGLTFELTEFYPDQYYHVTVWYKGKAGEGTLVADGMQSDFYKAGKSIVRDSMGWHQAELHFYIPPNPDFEQLRIYAWNQSGDTMFFDDFHLRSAPTRIYPEFERPSLQLMIDSADLEHLQSVRLRAFERGFLETMDDSYVKVKVIYGPDTLKGKIRFKGDFLEHLYGEKWSFRIKLKKKYSWNNMRTFSLHSPEARDFIDEEIAHKIFRSQDLLATRYGFVPVKLNGKSLGLYAYEEHFTKELPEAMERREGVIVKFSEDEMWYNEILKHNGYVERDIPFFSASPVLPFQENRTAENKYLLEQFSIAQDLMEHFRYATKPASEIFEIDKLARFMALTDITGGYHGIHWHNMRFYYNPVSCRLEPIAFDNYTGGEKSKVHYFGKYFYSNKWLPEFTQGALGLFRDKSFTELYLKYLEQYCESYNSIIEPLVQESLGYEDLIRKEFHNFRYEPFLKERVDSILNGLDDYRKFVNNLDTLKHEDFVPVSANDYKYYPTIPDNLVKAYTLVDKNSDELSLEVRNHFNQSIRLIGFIQDTTLVKFSETVVVNALSSMQISTGTFRRNALKSLVLETENADTLHRHEVIIFPWRSPAVRPFLIPAGSPDMSFISKHARIEGRRITFTPRNHRIDQNLIIPPGYEVVIPRGANLDLVNHSAFISYSPVTIRGTPAQRILIGSSDGTANGFTILKAPGTNLLEHVVFDQLNTMSVNEWNLTGAVNFYGTRVHMDHVYFTNNRCEDALNIINAEFEMQNCHFDNILADAFDSDFCTGKLTSSTFRDIGNDAIDFSGSQVEIRDCSIESTGDKGVSCGEASTLKLENVSVRGAVIGLACKDRSFTQGINVYLEDCEFGLVVFMKKAVYGPARATLTDSRILNTTRHYLIEKHSEAAFNGVEIPAEEEKVAKLFYL